MGAARKLSASSCFNTLGEKRPTQNQVDIMLPVQTNEQSFRTRELSLSDLPTRVFLAYFIKKLSDCSICQSLTLTCIFQRCHYKSNAQPTQVANQQLRHYCSCRVDRRDLSDTGIILTYIHTHIYIHIIYISQN